MFARKENIFHSKWFFVKNNFFWKSISLKNWFSSDLKGKWNTSVLSSFFLVLPNNGKEKKRENYFSRIHFAPKHPLNIWTFCYCMVGLYLNSLVWSEEHTGMGDKVTKVLSRGPTSFLLFLRVILFIGPVGLDWGVHSRVCCLWVGIKYLSGNEATLLNVYWINLLTR